MKHIKTAWNKVWTARQQWMLPSLLILTFLIQTRLFNKWLHISTTVSQQAMISAFCVAVLVLGPAMVLRRRARYIWLTIAALLLEVVFVAQYIYFLSFDTFIRGSAMRYVFYIGSVGESIKVQISPILLCFVVMLPIIGLWYWLVERKKAEPNYRLRTRLIALFGILAVVGLSFNAVLAAEKRKHGTLRELFLVPYDNSTMVSKVGVHMYSILDTYRYLSSPRGITTSEKQYIQDWAKNRPAQQTPGQNFGIAKGKNLIFVQMESFETFVIGRKIDGQEITPNLNQLIQESVYYANNHDQVSTGRTADGEFETQNSLLPPMDRVAFFEFPTHDYHGLPEVLTKAGYSANAFHGDVSTFWNRNVAYPYLGYQKYYDIESYKINKPIGWGLSDQEFIEQSIPHLTKLSQPFYANLIMLTSHTPFYIPDDQKQLKLSSDHGLSRQQIAYIQSVAYVDKQLGLLVRELKAKGLYDNSVLALFGDHRGFISNQNDQAFAKFLGLEKFDHVSFFTEGEKVPFIVHVPGSDVKGVVTEPSSHLDYAPTVLGLLGIKTPRSMLGQDLLAPHKPVAIQRNSTGSIELIRTTEVIYANPSDDKFASGKCYQASDRKQIDLQACKVVYDEQAALAKVSDLVVRGNALNLIK